ncbi:hypothetical protein ACFR99_16410 [Haloarchaeobius amylolyticus]|uniref:Uncharacterized protein n=1 Tax=Haloarchaeobius amylolyticus TaxID=1198296 RepID=A0ABD6BJF7_9EURY
MKRRRFLALASSGGMGATAGCLSLGGETYATLQRLDLTNPRREPVTVDVRIDREDTDEVAYLETHEILTDPNMVTLDCVWPDAPVTVMVRQMDGNWNRLTTSDYEDCLGVVAEIRNDRPSFVTHTAECPIRTAACHTDVAE